MPFIVEHFKKSIMHILFFACAFAILGYYIPRCYFTHFDKTVYYRIDNPVEIEKEVYASGDKVTATITREALIDLQAVSIKELALVNSNKEVAHEKTDLAINAGKEVVNTVWCLPQNLEDGIYYFRGVISYSIRGIEKTTTFYSEEFEVKNLKEVK